MEHTSKINDYRKLRNGVVKLANNLIKDGERQIFKAVYGLDIGDEITCNYVGIYTDQLTLNGKYILSDFSERKGIMYVSVINNRHIYTYFNLEKYFNQRIINV